MRSRLLLILFDGVSISVSALSAASAATAVGSLNVQITIQAECAITAAPDLDFGTQGVLDANIDQTSTISVQCTDGTPYSVGLGQGTGAGATVSTRYMTGPASSVIQYGLYQDAARSVIWGDTPATDTVDGTGNGAVEALTVYGRVPTQSTPAAGTYNDTVTITVTY